MVPECHHPAGGDTSGRVARTRGRQCQRGALRSVLQARKTQFLALRVVALGHRLRQLAHAQDVALALGDGNGAAGIEQAYAVFPRLSDRRNQLGSTLSGGEQQMLGLSKALITKPKLLVIDEFSLGLAPVIVAELLSMVRELNAAGTAVLIVEQSVNVALNLVDRCYFMEKGRVVHTDTAAALRAQPELVQALSLGGLPPELAESTA